MEHEPPHEASNSEPRGPSHERLQPGEVDLTGAVEQDDVLADVIADALAEAQEDGKVPEWGARALARALVNHQGSPGALHHFAVTGRADRDAMARELVTIGLTSPDADVQHWVTWLGKHVTDVPDAEHTAQTARLDGMLHNPHMATGFREHGDAFRSYVFLESTDLRRPDLLASFHDAYAGTFTNVTDVLEHLTELGPFLVKVDELADEWGFKDAIRLDWRAISAAVRNSWTLVETNGKIYAFRKQTTHG